MKSRVPFIVGPKIVSRTKPDPTALKQFENSLRSWLCDPKQLQFYPQERYRLEGVVVGHSIHEDGSIIGTSDVMVIEKVLKDTDLDDLLCAITKSGSRYFFRAGSTTVASF